MRAVARFVTPCVPKPISMAPSRCVSRTCAPGARQRSSVPCARDSLPAIPPAAIAKPAAASLLSTRGSSPASSPADPGSPRRWRAPAGQAREQFALGGGIEVAAEQQGRATRRHAQHAVAAPRPPLKARSRRRPIRNRASSQRDTGSEVAGQPPPTTMRSTPRSMANNAAPCARSCVECRAAPACRRAGARAHRAPASRRCAMRAPRVFQASPVSNSNTRVCVAMSTADAASGVEHADTRAMPPAAGATARTAAATQASGRVRRSGHGQRTAATTRRRHGECEPPGGGSARHCASSRSAAHTSAGHSQSYNAGREREQRAHRRPAPPVPRARRPAPAARARTKPGESRRRLTASPTSDTPPNTANVSGASASMMANCRRTARRSARRRHAAPLASISEDHAHRHERQPEARRQRRERHRTAARRPAPATRSGRRHVARAQPRASANMREHQPGALGGHGKSGEQRITAGRGRGLTTWRTARAPRCARERQPAPQQRAPRKRQQREQRDVQPGDGHQVRGARGIEHTPLIARSCRA